MLPTLRTPPHATERPPRYDAQQLLTSSEAAHAFRVGVSSIKRWTDEGELESVRTPGGHRRYTAASLHRFAVIRGLPVDRLPHLSEQYSAEIPPPADVTLLDAMVRGDARTIRQLVTPKMSSISKRAAFLDRVVGDALREIGYRWERGKLTVDQEHRASYIVAEAVDELRPPVSDSGPLALLACPPEELHELPLRLVRLILEWSGWQTEFVGAAVPWQAVRSAVERSNADLLALSSRNSALFQDVVFDELVAWCTARGTQVVVGGEWARGGIGGVEGYLRFRSLRGFERWLRTR